jgi:hypothetical protein
MNVSRASISSPMHLVASGSEGFCSAGNAAPRMIGVSSPGKSYLLRSSRTSISIRSRSSGSSTRSTLLRKTTMYCRPT